MATLHRLLAGRGVEHEQDFLRADEIAQADELLHEGLVNLEAAGGVEDQDVPLVRGREGQGLAGDDQDVLLAARFTNTGMSSFAPRVAS